MIRTCVKDETTDELLARIFNMPIPVELAEEALKELFKNEPEKLKNAIENLRNGKQRIALVEKQAIKEEGDYIIETKTTIDQDKGELFVHDHMFDQHKDNPDTEERKNHGHLVLRRDEQKKKSTIEYRRSANIPDRDGEVTVRDNELIRESEEKDSGDNSGDVQEP